VSEASALVIDSAVYGGHLYHLLSPQGWLEAELEAIGTGGHLVTINDAAENAFVTQRFGVETGLFANQMDFWIGLTDYRTEGVYEWISGEPVTFLNWAPLEPSDCYPINWPDPGCVTEDYSHIGWWANPPGQWNDLPDAFDLHAVVEVDPVPEPSSLLLLALGLGGVVRRARTWR
jgi:hypothetical protein